MMVMVTTAGPLKRTRNEWLGLRLQGEVYLYLPSDGRRGCPTAVGVVCLGYEEWGACRGWGSVDWKQWRGDEFRRNESAVSPDEGWALD